MLPIKKQGKDFVLTEIAHLMADFKALNELKDSFKHFVYLWFMHDFQSPLSTMKLSERMGFAAREAYGDGGYNVPPEVDDAEKAYIAIRNSIPEIQSYYVALEVLEKTQEYLQEIDLNERTNSGAKVYSVLDLQTAQTNLPKTTQTVSDLRRMAYAALELQSERANAKMEQTNVPAGRYEE